MARATGGGTDIIRRSLGIVPSTFPLTLSAIFRVPDLSSNRGIFHLQKTSGGGGAQDVGFFVFTNGDLFLQVSDNSNWNGPIAVGAISANVWYQIVGVCTSTTSRTLYIGNTAYGPNTVSLNPTGLTEVTLGGYVNTSGTLSDNNGVQLAEAAVWNVALSAADVASLQKFAPECVRTPALRFYADLIRGVQDRYGAGLAATGTTVIDHPPRLMMPAPRTIIKAQSVVSGGFALRRHGHLRHSGIRIGF